MFAQNCLDGPQCFWEHVLWTVKTEVELFGKNALYSNCTLTSSPHLNCEAWWTLHHGFSAILIPQGLDTMQLLKEQQILKCIMTIYRKMSGQQFMSLALEIG